MAGHSIEECAVPAKSPELRALITAAGIAARTKSPDAEDRRRELAAERLRLYIEKITAEAPPLTNEQRDRLVAILRPTPVGGP